MRRSKRHDPEHKTKPRVYYKNLYRFNKCFIGGSIATIQKNLEDCVKNAKVELYKDEVRHVAKLIDLPDDILKRHPFPGPGLAVRIIGKFNKEKLSICRHSSSIVEEELQKSGYYDKVWQAFAIVGDDKAVGVLGDNRKIGYIVTVRIVESNDAMTADWVRLPYDILDNISRRITNEVDNVSWVTYTISSKPPSTIEPQ